MANPLNNLSLSEIRDRITMAEARKRLADAEIKSLEDELSDRLSVDVATLFTSAGKISGDMTFETDGVKLKASISKTVKWDNDKLQALAAQMDWETAQRIFDIKFSVPERVFNAIPDQEMVAKLEDARTVKYGALTIKTVAEKE